MEFKCTWRIWGSEIDAHYVIRRQQRQESRSQVARDPRYQNRRICLGHCISWEDSRSAGPRLVLDDLLQRVLQKQDQARSTFR